MVEEIIRSVVFITLLALGGYFFVLFRRKGWFFPQIAVDDRSRLDHLCVMGRLSVGGRHYVAIIRCNEQKFLVGISPTSITSLGELRPRHRENTDKFHSGNLARGERNRSANGRDTPVGEALYSR
jgi:flagellar biogenesis protein FliO